MQVMQNFTNWLLTQLPAFLMSEPIIYFVAIIILAYIFKIITNLGRY